MISFFFFFFFFLPRPPGSDFLFLCEFSGSHIFPRQVYISASTVRRVFQYHFSWNNLLSIIFMAALNFKRELRGIENLWHISSPQRKPLINLELFSFTFKSDPRTKTLPGAIRPSRRSAGPDCSQEGGPRPPAGRTELALLNQT